MSDEESETIEWYFPDIRSYKQDAFKIIRIRKSKICIKCRRRVLAGSVMMRATFKGKRIYTTHACEHEKCFEDFDYIFDMDERVLNELTK